MGAVVRIWIPFLLKDSCIVHSLILSGEALILTLSILPCLEGWIFLIHPCRFPSTLKISHARDGFPNPSLVLVQHGYSVLPC